MCVHSGAAASFFFSSLSVKFVMAKCNEEETIDQHELLVPQKHQLTDDDTAFTHHVSSP